MANHDRKSTLAIGLGALALALVAGQALAQSGHNPFAVAGNEGSVSPTGIGGWLLAQQTIFYRMITGAVRAAKASGSATWGLAGISFAYGVFHAAGPGHGKAVIASYMVANERALRRGIAIAFFAALLQGIVAIGLVSIAALVLGATAQRITQVTDVIEMASYAGVALLGAWLVWQKGSAFVAVLRDKSRAAKPAPAAARSRSSAAVPVLAFAGHESARDDHPDHAHGDCCGHSHHPSHPGHGHAHHHAAAASAAGPVHDEHCGHFHAPDPGTLDEGFSWKTAILTVFSAGSRPCSGAILVLVFALAQGIFIAGIAATLAMSLGTAITTAALATTAVLFKRLAVKLAGGASRRSDLIARGVEVAAALGVLIVGLGLLVGAWSEGA